MGRPPKAGRAIKYYELGWPTTPELPVPRRSGRLALSKARHLALRFTAVAATTSATAVPPPRVQARRWPAFLVGVRFVIRTGIGWSQLLDTTREGGYLLWRLYCRSVKRALFFLGITAFFVWSLMDRKSSLRESVLSEKLPENVPPIAISGVSAIILAIIALTGGSSAVVALGSILGALYVAIGGIIQITSGDPSGRKFSMHRIGSLFIACGGLFLFVATFIERWP